MDRTRGIKYRTPMRRPFSSLMITLALLIAVVLPPLVYMVFHASSMAAGVLLVSGLYILLFAAFGGIRWRIPRLGALVVRFAAVLGMIFVQGMASFLMNGQFDFSRFAQSSGLLVGVLLGVLSLALLIRKVPDYQADFAVRGVFYVLLVAGIMGILNVSPFSSEWAKPVVFFSEPSHYALSFLPFLLYVTVNAKPGRKLLWVLSGFAIAFLIQNLTLAVGVTLVAGLTISLRRSLILALVVAASVLVAPVNLDYFAARIHMSTDSQNLSALVYLSGWERAYQDVSDTSGLGVGFQQFGIVGARGDIMDSIAALTGADLNVLNGGAVAPKLIGEFGVTALGMLLVYLIYFARSARWLREVSMGSLPRKPARVFSLSCFVMYSMDLFVRGSGYFASSGFLFFAATVWTATEGRAGNAFRLRHRPIQEPAPIETIRGGIQL